MKNDYSFKFVAVIILAGVIVALVGPAHSAKQTTNAELPSATHSTE